MFGVVGSSLKMGTFQPATPNMSQQGGQTYATCRAQQCCDILRCVWPPGTLQFVTFKERLEIIVPKPPIQLKSRTNAIF